MVTWRVPVDQGKRFWACVRLGLSVQCSHSTTNPPFSSDDPSERSLSHESKEAPKENGVKKEKEQNGKPAKANGNGKPKITEQGDATAPAPGRRAPRHGGQRRVKADEH